MTEVTGGVRALDWFTALETLAAAPDPFSAYTIETLWTDPHTAARMLEYHLDPGGDLASRNAGFLDESVAWLVNRFGIGPSSRIIDFGCGPGLYASRLAGTGARVTGLDLSASSLAHARRVADQQSLPITYLQQDYLTYASSERFDLALLIMCDYCALGPEKRRQLLGRIHDALRPGGALVLDVYGRRRFDAFEEGCRVERNLLNGFFSAQAYHGILHRFRYPAEWVTLDRYTIVERDRCRTWFNWLAHFNPPMLESELEQAGFSVDAWHADVAGAAADPGGLSSSGADMAVVARA